MAHEIDTTTGKAGFVSVQQPAWHGLGKVFDREITTEEALKEACLNFEVVKYPNAHRLPNGNTIISEDSFFTYRDDTLAVLGDKFGKHYVPFQNSETFGIVNDILSIGSARIETAGSIFGGKKVFVCLKLDDKIKVAGTDIVDQYLLIANAHDGSMAIKAFQTNVMVACNNTLTAALNGAKDQISIRHTQSSKAKFEQALKVMGILQENKELNTNAYEEMAKHNIRKKAALDYFGNIFFDQEEIKELRQGKKLDDVVSTRKKNILGEVIDYAYNGVGQYEDLDSSNLNMWYAYNAVTGFLTQKKYKSFDKRGDSILFGNTQTIIKRAGELALTPDLITDLSAVEFDVNNN